MMRVMTLLLGVSSNRRERLRFRAVSHFYPDDGRMTPAVVTQDRPGGIGEINQ